MKKLFAIALLLMVCGQHYLNAQTISGRIGYWGFDGNTNDGSGFGHTATANNTASYTQDRLGNSGKAIWLLGATYLTVLNDDAFNFSGNDFSISIWIKTGANFGGSIISKQSAAGYIGWNLWFDGGKVSFIGGADPAINIVESQAIYNDNNWHHIVAIRTGNDASNWKLYIDGKQDGTVTSNAIQSSNLSTTSPLEIGSREAGGFFTGALDELSIYNKALSASEVSTLYGIPDPADGRLAFWPFNANTIDETGRGHNAVGTGTTFTIDRFGKANSAIDFDGQDQMTVVQDATFNFGIQNFSISLWFKTGMTTQQGSLVAKQSIVGHLGWNLAFDQGKIVFSAGHEPALNVIESSNTFGDNQWHHVVVLRIGTSAASWKLYLDGTENNTVVQNAALANFSNAVPMYIGRRGDGNAFTGSLDDIAFYNRTLTISEITSIYQSQPPAPSQYCGSIYCDNAGNVSIGTPLGATGYRLSVQGKVMAEGVKVEVQSKWPDYVFDKRFELPGLSEVKNYIEINGHLPNVPKAATIEKEGVDLGEMNVVLLRKIEELTLYLIQQHEENIKQREEMSQQRSRIAALENIISNKTK